MIDWDYLQKELKAQRYLSTPRNNELLLAYLQAKNLGNFGRIVYKYSCGEKTLGKIARQLARADDFFKKDIDKLTEQEILDFRNALIKNKIKKEKTLIKWNNGKPHFEIMQTEQPLSFRTKQDYRQEFIEWFKFIMEYVYVKDGKEIKDITRFFTLPREQDYQEIKVDFLNDDEITVLLNNIRNRKFKAMVQLSLMSGARPCEIINIKIGKGHNLYKNNEGKWVIHLPKIKRMSYAKYPHLVDMYEDELFPFFDNLDIKSGELVFKTTDKTFRRLMLHYSNKYVGRKISPKILRKTARMLRTNAGYSHDWINKLMGHSPGSKVQGHYTNYAGIKNDDVANDRLKGQQYPSLKKEYETMKLKLQAQQEQMAEMQKDAAETKQILKLLALEKKIKKA